MTRPRPPIKVPPVRVPPERVPPVRVPPERVPPVGVPPERVPPVREPPIDQPPVQTKGTVVGAGSIAGSFLLRDALNQLDERTRSVVTKSLAGVLPQVLPAGTVGRDRTVNPEDFASLIPSAVVVAAGLDPARTPSPPPPILWEDGANQLVVKTAGVKAQLGTGFIELSIPVSCDQTGDTTVTVTFVTGTPDRPTGGVTTTEDHPRGPAIVVENWHEPLIAFAWQTVLIATSAVAGAVGTDASGGALITQTVAVTPNGLSVVPMAQHTFQSTISRLP